jgi:hypothetical protein
MAIRSVGAAAGPPVLEPGLSAARLRRGYSGWGRQIGGVVGQSGFRGSGGFPARGCAVRQGSGHGRGPQLSRGVTAVKPGARQSGTRWTPAAAAASSRPVSRPPHFQARTVRRRRGPPRGRCPVHQRRARKAMVPMSQRSSPPGGPGGAGRRRTGKAMGQTTSGPMTTRQPASPAARRLPEPRGSHGKRRRSRPAGRRGGGAGRSR